MPFTGASSSVQFNMAASLLRCSAGVSEILSQTAADARNFNQQNIAEFNLRGEHSRCGAHTAEEVQPVMSLFDCT
jgi:hypothetical protein